MRLGKFFIFFAGVMFLLPESHLRVLNLKFEVIFKVWVHTLVVTDSRRCSRAQRGWQGGHKTPTPNNCGSEKSQKCRKYFLQYSTFNPTKTLGSSMVARSLFLFPGPMSPRYAPVSQYCFIHGSALIKPFIIFDTFLQ